MTASTLAPALRVTTKISYGLGQLGEGIKNSAFEAFLFFYYNQALGLSATKAGIATFLALAIDAVVDPLLGSVSDSLRSKWGRRHPFMVVGALPFGLMFYLLFSPPQGLSENGLFLWLIGFAVAVRFAMSVYLIPHNALGAELSPDYHERTSIAGWRILFGLLGAFVTRVSGYGYFFRDTAEHSLGLANRVAYPQFAEFFAIIASAAVLWSAFGTRSRIPYLVVPMQEPERFTWRRLGGELRESLHSPSFRALFGGTLVLFVTTGVQGSLSNYMSVHFWELSSKEITLVAAIGFLGLVVGIPFFARLSRTLDKKPTFLIGVTIFCIFAVVGPVLKLLDFWPSRDDTAAYLGLLSSLAFLASFGAGAGLITATSMMADLTDEHEYDTGRRQEGIFFGALAFSGKASSGLGHMLAGAALDLVGFPENAARGSVAPEVVRHLGMIYGPGTILMLVLGVAYFTRYQLTRDRVGEIQRKLAERRAGGG